MNLDDINIFVKLVNDEELYVIDQQHIDTLKFADEIEGIKIGGPTIKNSLDSMIEFVKKHTDFTLAMHKYFIGQSRYKWIFCVLYEMAGEYQRVQIENTMCAKCGWQGIVANPTIPSLYDTVKDRNEALNLAWNLPSKSCPSCGEKLDRHNVWNE